MRRYAVTTFDREAARRFLHALFGDHRGTAVVGLGYGGHYDGGGKYVHDKFVQRPYPWPAAEERLLHEIEATLASAEVDVYICGLLRKDGKRQKGNAAHHDVLWADADNGADDEAVRALGGFSVLSGTPRHCHVYLTLDGDVEAVERDRLARALRDHFGGDKGKFADNDFLRLPGTLNFKAAARGGSATPVRFAVEPNGRVPVERVRELLDVETPVATVVPLPRARVDVAPVQAVVGDPFVQPWPYGYSSGDRSADLYAVVSAEFVRGHTYDQAMVAARRHCPQAAEKYGDRLDDEVRRVWDKLVDDLRGLSPAPSQASTADPDRALAEAVFRERLRVQARDIVAAETRNGLTAAETPSAGSRLVRGDEFILGSQGPVPAVWGEDGGSVLWSRGEPLLITGPPGAGKTTLVGQLVAGRLGLLDTTLGFPVVPGRRVLYLAMDRPKQIGRALARVLTNMEVLQDRFVVHRGPPTFDIVRHPEHLLDLVHQADADTLVIDSYKDIIAKLTDDEQASALNRAIQHCIADEIEVVGLHHQRKDGANGGKPTTLADVYGSAWLTAGVGSVILLWGAAGDPIVELSHLKQPAETVGPWQILHDHDRGISRVYHGIDVMTALRQGPQSARSAARLVYGDPPKPADVERARRALNRLVKDGKVAMQEELFSGGDGGGGQGAQYRLIS